MIHRIIEAFTRPHYQVTAVDEFIQTATVIAAIFILAIIIAVIFTKE